MKYDIIIFTYFICYRRVLSYVLSYVNIILQVMTTASMFLLLSILILTGGTLITNLYTADSVLAKESVCNLEILSMLPCTLGDG